MELLTAQQAVEKADRADADQYAPDTMAMARQQLGQAQQAATDRRLRKQVPDISPVQYDIRTLLKAARAINNGDPFPGERLLHRLLDKTYYAHILPPLPDAESARLWQDTSSRSAETEELRASS